MKLIVDDKEMEIIPTNAGKVIIHKSRGVQIYVTEIEMWSGFGLVGSTGKNWANYEQLLIVFFYVFMGKNLLIFQVLYD